MALVSGPGSDVPALFAAHYLSLVRLALRLVDDQETAEDVVQDVFAALARTTRTLDDPSAYLRGAVVNRCRSALRRRRVSRLFAASQVVEDVDEPADAGSVRRAERTRMLAAIRTLPRRQREVVVLRYYEDLAVAEVATTLAISPAAVSSALHRALAALADQIGDDHGD